MKTLKTHVLSGFSILFATNACALQVGDQAPDFTAQSTSGKITLREIRKNGPVVLAFYSADFTPV